MSSISASSAFNTSNYLPSWSLPEESIDQYQPKKFQRHVDPRVHIKKDGAGKHNWGSTRELIQDAIYQHQSSKQIETNFINTCQEETLDDEFTAELEYALYLSTKQPQPLPEPELDYYLVPEMSSDYNADAIDCDLKYAMYLSKLEFESTQDAVVPNFS
ncbi:hypothetical protein HDV02_006559 [Globomyces sp. JEL0801]|nr:hypothetical protein HDV02_006559 [Globomyces sp. JEL0801]